MVDAAHLGDPTLARPIRVETAPRPARIALAHDWLVARRGGELVLDEIAALVERDHVAGSLYTMCARPGAIGEHIGRMRIVTSPLQRLGAAGRLRRWMLPLYPRAVASLSAQLALDQRNAPIDLLISSSSCAIKGLRPPPGVPHLCYCHAPARYVWGHRHESARGSMLRSVGLAAYGPRFRAWDRETAQTVTRFIANSGHTARMIRDAYGRESTVVHPAVRTDFFTPDPARQREDFWLVVSALEPYKRVDLAIRAAAIAGQRLVIVGTGSIERELRAMAPSDVRFEIALDDSQVRDRYRRARGVLFPQIEDFGIVAVEAQACGCPVVARRAGGALDTVVENETGAFFDEPTPGSVAEAMARIPAGGDPCRRNAERFGPSRFRREMAAEIDRALAQAAEASPDF